MSGLIRCVSIGLLFWLVLEGGECFIPANMIEFVTERAVHDFRINLGEVSETLVHEDIIKRGIIRSVAKYLHDQKDIPHNIKMDKIETRYYKDARHLYHDYYNKWVCNLELDYLISSEFQPSVAVVDFDDKTKDLPYAHFDAETFRESNERVMNFTQRILDKIALKEYQKARRLSGQILHTIHDFYSHSNWVEMGNHHKINSAIGTPEFNKQLIAGKSDNITCMSNCTLVTVKCNTLLKLLFKFMKTIKKFSSSQVDSSPTNTCPLRYFQCKGNIVVLDKLVSGYYVHQTLPNNVTISKPLNAMKCSHGGIVDTDSFKPAIGGINKDSGYYLFSPHAELHLIAARLAIRHTEFFFNEIRKKIGDHEFNQFLRIKINDSFLNSVENAFGVCSGAPDRIVSNAFTSFLLIFLGSFLLNVRFFIF